LQELRPELLQELSLNACLNGKAFLIEHGDLLEFVGNRTECALLVLARKWGINYQKVLLLIVTTLILLPCAWVHAKGASGVHPRLSKQMLI
jgi:Ca2+-transporting ATPase